MAVLPAFSIQQEEEGRNDQMGVHRLRVRWEALADLSLAGFPLLFALVDSDGDWQPAEAKIQCQHNYQSTLPYLVVIR